MIIATAGHVDHGKTTLVKALTGVDTDCLQQEKQRGMTIEPGFAYADLGNGELVGFVDVPGHERFVRNMLTGVACVDFALLVIAADDGPMPQTREHLAILELLGIARAAVALTKIDRVSAERSRQAQAEITALLSTSNLHGAPIFPIATPNGHGIEPLRLHLAAVAATLPMPAPQGNFRLAIDRSFSVDGAGLVVTGAVFSGAVHSGDQLLVAPAGISVRVRGIQVHSQRAERASVGQRCALNLAGSDLKRSQIKRGDWLVASAAQALTERLDVRLKVVGARPLTHGASVHMHLGTADINARVALLQARAIAPGDSGLAQLLLDRPLMAWHGDHVILRDQSAQHTVAGGSIIDPFGPARARAKPQRLRQLAAMENTSPAEAVTQLLALQPDGMPLAPLVQAWNLTAGEAAALFAAQAVIRFEQAQQTFGVTAARWQALRQQWRDTLGAWHIEQPEALGLGEMMLAERIGMRVTTPLWRAVSSSLCAEGLIVKQGVSVRLAGHQPRLGAADASLLARVTAALQSFGLRPPVTGALAQQLELEPARLLAFLEHAAQLGHLIRVAPNRYFLPAALEQLIQIAAQLAAEAEGGLFLAAAYRDRSGIGRNLTIEVLEFMDQLHITRFAGGRRRMLT